MDEQKSRSIRLRESLNAKRAIRLAGRKTSIGMELPFWEAFKEIAAANKLSLSALVTRINSTREHPNLSSAIRLFVLNYYRDGARRIRGY